MSLQHEPRGGRLVDLILQRKRSARFWWYCLVLRLQKIASRAHFLERHGKWQLRLAWLLTALLVAPGALALGEGNDAAPSPAERLFGLDFSLSGGMARTRLAELRRTLAAEDLGDPRTIFPEFGFSVGGAYESLRVGCFIHDGAFENKEAETDVERAAFAPYLGWEFVRRHPITVWGLVEYEFQFLHLMGLGRLPSFVSDELRTGHVFRSAHALGFSLGQDFWLHSFRQGRGFVGWFVGSRVGYSWDVWQGQRWHFRRGEDASQSSIPGGPGVRGSGWRAEIRIGATLFGSRD